MLEIRFHGRGGMGAKTAGEIIAQAILASGKHVQAFPEYGPERAGAPMRTYVRSSDKIIGIYEPIVSPDVVVVIDPTQATPKSVVGLKEGGVLVVNSPFPAKTIKKNTGFPGDVFAVDASKIALECFGRDIPNTAMVGALVKVTKLCDLSFAKKVTFEVFEKKLGKKKAEANVLAVERGFKEVKK